MTRSKGFAVFVSTLLVSAFAVVALAQDPVKVAPKNYKVILENAHVRVLEITVAPGEKVAMHSHPASVIYALNNSKIRFSTPDGKSVDVDLKAGEASWHEAETHAGENIGKTEGKVLQIEMKSPAHAHPHKK
jgi:beta-alanine degradation protein BauB